MASKRPRREQFTVEEANATLPLVRAIVTDLAHLSRELTDRRRRLSFLLAGRNPNEGDPYQQELLQVQDDLEKDSQRLRGYVTELRELGVESRSGAEGLVAFPSILDGRRVCLSWKLGEAEILYWHEAGGGFRRRHRLPTRSLVTR
jgi:hypothetical protein